MIGHSLREVAGQPSEANELYRALRGLLTQHISSITTDAILNRWFEKSGVSEDEFTVAQAERLIDESSRSLRMFVDPEVLPQLFLDVAELLMSAES